MGTQNKKIAYLNGLKGLACFPVLLGHFRSDFVVLPGFEDILHIPCFKTILINGNWALNIFFIISALLIAQNIICDKELNYSKLAYKMVKRYFRLSLPLFVLYETIWIIQELNLFANQQVATILGTEKYLGQYFLTDYTQLGVMREAFIGTLFNGEFTFNSVMWMMQIMFVGYYLSVILALLIRWGGDNCVAIVGIVCAFMLMLNSQYLLFVAGVLLAYLLTRKEFNKKIACVIGGACLVGGCFFANYCHSVVAIVKGYSQSSVLTSWYLYSKIGAILFMAGVVMCAPIQRILSIKPFQWLNKLSFPIFMFHRVIEGCAGSLIFLWIYESSGSKDHATRMAWVGTVVVLFLVSAIYAYFVEPLLNKATDKIMKFVMGSSRQKEEKVA